MVSLEELKKIMVCFPRSLERSSRLVIWTRSMRGWATAEEG